MMKIESFIIREIGIPFKMAFSHNLSSRSRTQSVIIEIQTGEGVCGFGEGAPREYVTGESMETTVRALKKAGSQLKGIRLRAGGDILKRISRVCDELVAQAPSARCALELSLMDLYAQHLQRPVLHFFPPLVKPAIYYSGVISGENPEKVKQLLKKIKPFQFRQVKLKVGSQMETDLLNLQSVRSVLGKSVEIRVDANGAWDPTETVERIRRFREYGVAIVEQPLPAERPADYPDLLQAVPSDIQILIDESLCSFEDAVWFSENRGATGFNLKISKQGGLLPARRIAQFAKENGISCQLGCHVGETSILTAAGRVMAGTTSALTACEGSFGPYLLAHDITETSPSFGFQGKADLKEIAGSIGWGQPVRPALLARATTQTHEC